MFRGFYDLSLNLFVISSPSIVSCWQICSERLSSMSSNVSFGCTIWSASALSCFSFLVPLLAVR